MTKDEAIAIRVKQLRGVDVPPAMLQEALMVISMGKLTAAGLPVKGVRLIPLDSEVRERANARLLFNLGRACRGPQT